MARRKRSAESALHGKGDSGGHAALSSGVGGRATSEQFEIADYVLPAGANIVLSRVTHRDPRWFPDPERF